MSELYPDSRPTPDTYQAFVASTQFDMGDDWETQYAQWIRSESIEFLGQHGPGSLVLLPEMFDIDNATVHRIYPELKHEMLDEMGDLIWFGFSTAERLGIKAFDACQSSLEVYGFITDEPLTNFESLTEVVCSNADKIGVANKLSVLAPEADESLKFTTINQNPFYVFQRTVARLCRVLDKSGDYPIIPSMTDLEEKTEITQSIGDYINTLAYIAKVQLNSDIQTSIDINIDKLEKRRIYGKQ